MRARRGLHWLGAGLILLSFGLLAKGLMTSGKEVAELVSATPVLALTIGLSAVYGALLVLPALAWANALHRPGSRSPAAFVAVGIYARCNILKYLPGNVFHFGGRQVLARQAGWAHEDILLASLLETALLPLAAIWVALVLLAFAAVFGDGIGHDFGLTLINGLEPIHVMLGVGAAAGITIAACLLAFRRGAYPASLAMMALLETGFFAANAALICGLALMLYSPEPVELCVLAAAYLASWVAGFLTPGAPGGIGVREALFVQLAATVVPVSGALALAILARLVTSLGDLWFALASFSRRHAHARSEIGGRGQ